MKITKNFKLKIRDFIFNSTRVKADIIGVKVKKKFIRNKEDIQFFLKDFIFHKYICKMYIWADIKRRCRKSRFF